ncbi:MULTISPECIES: transporter substrate-binding domain-containing protein [unclassified Burkholderia]|uniref:transporter substrate-binding domain-containing protein n=1 Tax=unclassified Burkholderia TaxID=2613784 RepID=UPI000F598CEF|nr:MULTISPECIES: transporter substrate-binding domain-containing protein [unclassified Burkholderia]RQR32519.1 ABC transporter substrate-binding protein [Burkholderia sp. Bp9131]RQR67091.1 ABC transporter substrate-binding protein [Burkholderia sp. Bp9015]
MKHSHNSFLRRTARCSSLALGIVCGISQASATTAPSFVDGNTLNVCTAGEFPPMEYYAKPGDTTMVGFEVDVVTELAKLWGVKPKFVVVDFKGLLPSLDAHRCGLVASGIMITPERTKRYDGTAYFKSSVVMVTASNSSLKTPDDLSGHLVAIEAGTTYEKVIADLNAGFAKKGLPPVSMQTYPSSSAVIQQVLVGRAAATITQDTSAAFRLMQVPGRLSMPYTYPQGEYYGLYMRRQANDVQMVKAGLASLQRSGVMRTLLRKWNLPEDATSTLNSNQ